MAKSWQYIQGRHFESLDLPESQVYKTGLWWTANLIRQVTYFSLNTWQIHNDSLHSDKKERLYNEDRSELCKRMRWWYNKAPRMGEKMQKYFRKSALVRGRECNQNIACWIDTFEANYKYAIDRGQERACVFLPEPISRGG